MASYPRFVCSLEWGAWVVRREAGGANVDPRFAQFGTRGQATRYLRRCRRLGNFAARTDGGKVFSGRP